MIYKLENSVSSTDCYVILSAVLAKVGTNDEIFPENSYEEFWKDHVGSTTDEGVFVI